MGTSAEGKTPSPPEAAAPKPTTAPSASGESKPTADAPPVARAASLPRQAPAGAKSSGAGLSALSDANLEQTVIRRGLVTEQELQTCKAHRARLAESGQAEGKGLLEVMVAAKALTPSQAQRLLRDLGREAQKKHEIPGYQLLEKLGKGSMGIVYKAKQTSVDRVVAVKVLLDVLARNKEFIHRFQREATIAARLNHPNIVNAIDAGEVNGLHYFVMEFVEGTTIKDVIEGGHIYDEPEALRIVLAVAEAMKHAHERGLIHRDIKPENIILTKDGNVKLADLGLARLTADEKQAVAEAGMAIGTPYYISPEQVRGATDVDIRSDIYNLGATLYHMVTGRPPFPGDDPTEVMKKHVDKSITLTPPDHLNTRLSSGLGEVVETMMARNRENRYRDPGDVLIDLKALIEGKRPVIAEQKADTLAKLAEGDADEDEDYYEDEHGSAMTDSERVELAGIVNARNNIITVLAILLGLSLVSNIILMIAR
ncbi:serine/threonine-protein kinase [Tautonia rosea]|uniref:serine/threonine-protein kinase n=1 Tax=Tautonia rosea TaxID=2728037 RepID=UPI001475FB32|nr:serine/threonine-protein kinase [Tautonia rosea]